MPPYTLPQLAPGTILQPLQDTRRHALLQHGRVRVQALQGEQNLAAMGRVGCSGVPRAVGSGVAQQKTRPTIASVADSVGVLSSLAAQASGQAQAVAYTLLVMRLFEPHRSAPCARIVCPVLIARVPSLLCQIKS